VGSIRTGVKRVKTDPCTISVSMQSLRYDVRFNQPGMDYGLRRWAWSDRCRSTKSVSIHVCMAIDKQGSFVCCRCHRGGVDIP
jgi:hypothetical protein